MKKDNLGFTLVELLIASVLLALVGLAAGLVYTSGYRGMSRALTDIETSTAKAYLLEHISSHLHNAQEINVSSPNQIAFWDVNKMATSSYSWDSGSKQITYKPDISGGSSEVIAKNVEDLAFTPRDNISVNVRYKLKSKSTEFEQRDFDITSRVKAAIINTARRP